jgi:hypothetical protein
MECVRPRTISASKLRQCDIQTIPPQTTNLRLASCTSTEWEAVLKTVLHLLQNLTHLQL